MSQLKAARPSCKCWTTGCHPSTLSFPTLCQHIFTFNDETKVNTGAFMFPLWSTVGLAKLCAGSESSVKSAHELEGTQAFEGIVLCPKSNPQEACSPEWLPRVLPVSSAVIEGIGPRPNNKKSGEASTFCWEQCGLLVRGVLLNPQGCSHGTIPD